MSEDKFSHLKEKKKPTDPIAVERAKTYEDVMTISARVLDPLHEPTRSFLDASKWRRLHDIGVGVTVCQNSLPFCMLLMSS